jgi:transcriptional regulator with XRE-family HTH domain
LWFSLCGFQNKVTICQERIAHEVKSEQGYDMDATQCKMARAAMRLGVRDLAKLASVSPDTIARLERGEELRQSTIDSIRNSLEIAGVEFTAENGGGVGVRLKKVNENG